MEEEEEEGGTKLMVYITIPTNIDAGKREKKKVTKSARYIALKQKTSSRWEKLLKKKGFASLP